MTKLAIGTDTVETKADVAENLGASALIEDAIRNRQVHLVINTTDGTKALSDSKSLRRATLMRAAEIYGERFADADGRVRATFDLVWLSGWAPHESQQKPLRPGSARARLADALGVPEYGPTGDPR